MYFSDLKTLYNSDSSSKRDTILFNNKQILIGGNNHSLTKNGSRKVFGPSVTLWIAMAVLYPLTPFKANLA